MENQTEKPESLDDAHLTYLDALRESGATNMFGAAPYLEREFGLTRKEAREVLTYWMVTFESRNPN